MDIKFTIEAIFWVVIGLALIKLIRYNRKDKDKKEEPKAFDFKYWLKDNYRGVLINILFTIISVKFTADIVSYVNLEYLQFGDSPMFVYLLLGFAQQAIIDFLQKIFK